jgi:S1-C subfamily serine protease
LAILTAVVVLNVFVPYFVEHIQYALVRGQQRAEVEVAGQALKSLPLEDLSHAYQLISKRIGPSVVHINVVGIGDATPDEYAAIFGQRVQQGEGSGVIVDAKGYILTNNHVVRGARRIRVMLSDGRTISADLVGKDSPTDLAVLKIDVSDLTAAEWGNSDDLETGALVWAVGSPFGLQQTITFGILSAKNRENISNSPYLDFLQTDAAVNPGNSGGPLVDASGHVIGINTAIVGESYRGISFAIPSSVAQRVYEKIKSRGHVDRGWLGVNLVAVDESVARQYNLSVERGALVHELSSGPGLGSPAGDAGIRPGDVILKWNGFEIYDAVSLQRQVALIGPGSQAEVVVLRQGREITVEVTLEERPQSL